MMPFWLAVTALASLCRTSLSQSIDPNSVPLSTREQWCTSQISECPLICLQEAGNSAGTNANDCDPTTLTFDCVCSNGIAPNASQYSLTLPYYICTQINNNCVAGCGNDNACASACRQDHPCGAQNPERVNTSTLTTMSATGTGGAAASTAVYTGFGGGGSAATSSAGGANGSAATRLALSAGELYGLGVVAAGIFFGFSTLL